MNRSGETVFTRVSISVSWDDTDYQADHNKRSSAHSVVGGTGRMLSSSWF